MRSLAGAIVLGCGVAAAATTACASPSLDHDALRQAAFAQAAPMALGTAALFTDNAFDPDQPMAAGPATLPDGLVRWSTSQARLGASNDGRSVDTLRLSVASPMTTNAASVLDLVRGVGQAYEVSVTRNWPAAMSIATKSLDVNFTPHAGLGLGSLGPSAEAGAEIEFRRHSDRPLTKAERLAQMGISDSSRFGDQGRFYLYMATGGHALGLNMTQGDGGWDRAGVTTDTSSRIVGDRQLGVGWRKGALQTSLGYVHQGAGGKTGHNMIWAGQTHGDSRLALSFTLRPGGR